MDFVYRKDNRVRRRSEDKYGAIKLVLKVNKNYSTEVENLSGGRLLMRILFNNGDHYETQFESYDEFDRFNQKVLYK